MKGMKRKRLFVIFLTMIFCLSLFACGETPDNTNSKIIEETTASIARLEQYAEEGTKSLRSPYLETETLSQKLHKVWAARVISRARTEMLAAQTVHEVVVIYREAQKEVCRMGEIEQFLRYDVGFGVNLRDDFNAEGLSSEVSYTVSQEYAYTGGRMIYNSIWQVNSLDEDVKYKTYSAEGVGEFIDAGTTEFQIIDDLIQNYGENSPVGVIIFKDSLVIGYTVLYGINDNRYRSVSFDTPITEEQALAYIENYLRGNDGEADAGVDVRLNRGGYFWNGLNNGVVSLELSNLRRFSDNPTITVEPQSQTEQDNYVYEVVSDISLIQDGGAFTFEGEQSNDLFIMIKNNDKICAFVYLDVEWNDGVVTVVKSCLSTFRIKTEQMESDYGEIPDDFVQSFMEVCRSGS